MSRHRTGTRTNRRKRGLIRRVGIVFPVAVIAALAVIGVAVGAAVFSPGSGAFNVAQAVEAVPGSHTMALLEAERSQLIAMTTAARTVTVVAAPNWLRRPRWRRRLTQRPTRARPRAWVTVRAVGELSM